MPLFSSIFANFSLFAVSAPMNPPTGILHERYRLQSLLGRQTGRRTFLANDSQTASPVVVKLLLFGPDFTWEELKLFEREAEVLKSLTHPAIPKYLNYFETETEFGKGFALVQIYIEAKSLQEWIQSGHTFSEEEIKAIAKDLLEILDYLHSHQLPVVHRDIKPSNILLRNRSGHSPGQVYLIDFGSVQTTTHGGTRTVVGTYGYMPLEQFGGQSTPTSDLYALGATLIYLATGQHPDQLPQHEMRMVFDDQVNLSPVLIDWLKWLTEPSADLRPKSAKQAIEALETSALRESGRLVKRGKPAGTRVQVTQTRQELEIVIPPRGFYPKLILAITWAILLNTFLGMLFLAGLEVWASGEWIFALLRMLPLFFGFKQIWRILFTFFGKVRLRMTESEIIRTSEIFGLRVFRLVADRQTITEIEVTSPRQEAGKRSYIVPQIIIWAGTAKFLLGGEDSSSLTSPEREWLAQKLSDWLNLPITELSDCRIVSSGESQSY